MFVYARINFSLNQRYIDKIRLNREELLSSPDFAPSLRVEHQSVIGDGDERVPLAPGMDPKDRATDADTGSVHLFVTSADLHVAATDSRRYDRSLSLAGTIQFLSYS